MPPVLRCWHGAADAWWSLPGSACVLAAPLPCRRRRGGGCWRPAGGSRMRSGSASRPRCGPCPPLAAAAPATSLPPPPPTPPLTDSAHPLCLLPVAPCCLMPHCTASEENVPIASCELPVPPFVSTPASLLESPPVSVFAPSAFLSRIHFTALQAHCNAPSVQCRRCRRDPPPQKLRLQLSATSAASHLWSESA